MTSHAGASRAGLSRVAAVAARRVRDRARVVARRAAASRGGVERIASRVAAAASSRASPSSRGPTALAAASSADGDLLAEKKKSDETSKRVVEVTRKRGECYGCGVALQTDHPDVSGYVPPEEYETKRVHRQLYASMLCSRCSALSNGRMINAVAGQGGARADDFSGLITPEQLRESLAVIRAKKALVVKVVDATDFHGSFLNRVRDVVGANPILLVLTKIDLLPRGTDAEKLKDWVFDEVVEKRRLTLAGVVCVSSRKGDGVRDAVGAMFSERKGRDVYVLGSANVGKSTFIRAALRAMREGGNFGVPGKRLPTASAMPGTTLGVIPLRAFEGKGTLYDTPGVFLHHRMNSILSGEDIKRFKLGSTLVKYVPRPRVDGEEVDRASFEGLTLLWGPLLRVDITEATPSASLAFYGPKGLRVRVAETSSLPSGEDIEREVEAREADAAAKRLDDLKALVTEEEEDAGGGVALAPSASAAVEAHREAAAEATTTTTTTTTTTDSDSDSDSDSYSDSYSDPDPELAPEIFHRRLVKEIFVEAADRDPPGALSDACVSGLGGWIRVRREGRSGETRLNARVWGPRGLEVFVRAPMPCGQ